MARVTSLYDGEVAGNTPAFFGFLGGSGDAALYLRSVSLSLHCSPAHSFVTLLVN